MSLKGEELTLRIAELQNAIRKKYRQFKHGIVESDERLEKQYKPLIKELRKKKNKEDVKTEPKIEDDETVEVDFKPETVSSPEPPSFLEDELIAETSDPDIRTVLSTSEGKSDVSRLIEESFEHPLTRKYMSKMIKNLEGEKNTIDHLYGPRYENETLMVGDKHLQFETNGNIRIGDVAYKGTEGLYELLFKRIPDDELYNENDLKAYKDILQKSNAHKRNYRYQGNVNRNQSIKYKNVISLLFPKHTYGTGVILKSVSSPDIGYWNDPNELCERLRLLVTSVEAGNTGHRNEIINIFEELREAKLISGSGNQRYKSLLK